MLFCLLMESCRNAFLFSNGMQSERDRSDVENNEGRNETTDGRTPFSFETKIVNPNRTRVIQPKRHKHQSQEEK